MIGKKYYTAKEIAAFLAVTPMTVYRLAERGELKAIRVGKSIRFDAEAVEEFIKQARHCWNSLASGQGMMLRR
jgi:excisionase family DNA binding protein